MIEEYTPFAGTDEEGNQFFISRYGYNTAVGSTSVPITQNGVYRTPQASAATTLRIKAGGNANDTAAGSGAQEVTIVGLNSVGALISDKVSTNGASASSATTKQFIRVWRCYVSKSGTYASNGTLSQAGVITIENGVGGTDWAQIGASGSLFANAEIGCFTVPLGYTARILRFGFASDSTKITNIDMMRRGSILQTSTPYSPFIRVFGVFGTNGSGSRDLSKVPFVIPELTDIFCRCIM